MADILYSPHFFWLVCAAFYLVDQFQAHAANEIILSDSGRGQWAPVFLPAGLKFGPYRVSVMNPLKPWGSVVRMRWGSGHAFSTRELTRARRLTRIHAVRTRPEKLICTAYCGALFGAGPLLTELYGTAVAILAFAPLHLGCAVALGLLLSLRNGTWCSARPARLKLALQLALCPGFLSNGYRRSCLLAPMEEGDGIAFALLSDAGTGAILPGLRDYLDDHGSVAEASTLQEYMSRLEELKAHGQRA